MSTTHVYSSRGRTRQPKNLALPTHQSQAIALASGSVTFVAAETDLDDELDHATAARNGYDTQNQNHLHLMLRTTGSSAGSVTVYAYNRCFGKWGKLRIPITAPAAATAAAMYIPATFVGTASKTEYVIVPIHGIDRVAFVGTANDLIVYAAGSTI
tara:strand:- start:424 stop:891 length:468 start_codon:yes stop_codon:yes gene_type:complete